MSELAGYLIETQEKAKRAVKEAFGDGADLFDVCLNTDLIPADTVYVVESEVAGRKRSLWMSRETVEQSGHEELVQRLRGAYRTVARP